MILPAVQVMEYIFSFQTACGYIMCTIIYSGVVRFFEFSNLVNYTK